MSIREKLDGLMVEQEETDTTVKMSEVIQFKKPTDAKQVIKDMTSNYKHGDKLTVFDMLKGKRISLVSEKGTISLMNTPPPNMTVSLLDEDDESEMHTLLFKDPDKARIVIGQFVSDTNKAEKFKVSKIAPNKTIIISNNHLSIELSVSPYLKLVVK